MSLSRFCSPRRSIPLQRCSPSWVTCLPCWRMCWFIACTIGEHFSNFVKSATEAILKTLNLFDTVLLILTLCFHSVFDGLAFGIAATTAETWKEMWMVGLHKFVLALALGIIVLRLASNRPLLNSLLYGFAFAISTSIGVAIGIIINTTAEGSTADWIFSVWMGIGTGVFIYVVINHLLAWDNHKLLHKEQALFRWS